MTPHDTTADAKIRNRSRAEWADTACRSYAAETGMDYPDEVGTAISDLIASLLHLTDVHGLDYEDALDRARMHYEAEAAEAMPFTRRRKQS